MNNKLPIVVSIAGSDPSAGAGIQQDLKVITRLGCYGATVVTALTSQNTLGVSDVFAVPASVVESQLKALLDDLKVCAVKIGQLPNSTVAQVVVEQLERISDPIVLDPVMISTSGRRLMEEDCVQMLERKLFAQCSLVTPNLPEAEHLLGREIRSLADTDRAGSELVERYGCNFLLKGGHRSGDECVDVLYTTDGERYEYVGERFATHNLHGTGCALSSAIASLLARGLSLPEAVGEGTKFVGNAIQKAIKLQIGHGNGPIAVWE